MLGREFEQAARLFFAETGVHLRPNFVALVGHSIKKPHRFDLGSDDPPILVECKSFTWTSGGNSPSAKLRNMNEVMLHFSVCPSALPAHSFRVEAHAEGSEPSEPLRQNARPFDRSWY